jgi:hypothetical protein
MAQHKGYKSKFEHKFAMAMKEAGIDFKYEPDSFPYMQRHSYSPDWKLGGFYIETKGYFTGRDRTKHLLIRQQFPDLDIRFVFMNANVRLHKKSLTTYGDWCDKHCFKWAQREIPDEWIEEARKTPQKEPSKKRRSKVTEKP